MATRTVSARTLWMVLAAVLMLGSAIMWVMLTRGRSEPRRALPTLVELAQDSTATIGYAGAMPSAEESSLARPLGLDGDEKNLYVALADVGAIAVFGYDGALEATLAVAAAEGAASATPVDLAVLSDGRIAVVDTAGSRVLIVDPGDPNSRGEEFSGGAGTGRILDPTAIEAVDDSIFIADASDGSVKEYSETGSFIRAMIFESPRPTFIGGLCVDADTLWVSDSNADRVISVDLRVARQSSVLQQKLSLPRGIAVTGEGEVMVAETFGRRIAVFDPTGHMSTAFPDDTTENVGEAGLLMAPESVLWDEESSRLYVTDAIDGRIKVYNYRANGS